MEYKGYAARVEFDPEAGLLFGEVEGIRDVVTFEATSVQALQKAFRDSVDDYLAMCAARGESPEKPYSGRYVVRLEPGLHRAAALAAARRGMSLNALTSLALEQVLASERRREDDRPAPVLTASSAKPLATYPTMAIEKQIGLFSISEPAETGPTNTGPTTPAKHAA